MPILASPTPEPLPPSHGGLVANWMESNLVHGEGDREGEPYRLAPHLERLLYRWFEYDPASVTILQPRRDVAADVAELLRRGNAGDRSPQVVDGLTLAGLAQGVYSHRKGVVGWAKGSAKTEFEAALALEHLEGPSWVKGTPVVTVGAVDGGQANELLRIADMMCPSEEHDQVSDLRERLHYTPGGDSRPAKISQRHGRGRILSTSAALGKNDGKRTSLLLCDEVHEWDYHSDAGAKRHGILERNTNKREGSRQLNVSTAGWSLESLLGGMYQTGRDVAAGDVPDPGFLMEWWEATEGLDLDDDAQLEQAIREANPMAELLPWLVDTLKRSYLDHKARGKVGEWLRYHGNRWVDAPDGDEWLEDIELWNKREAPGRRIKKTLEDGNVIEVAPPPPRDTEIVVAFDGSRTGDSTAIIGVTVSPTPYVFVIDIIERPERDPADWHVSRQRVRNGFLNAADQWTVRRWPADESYWHGELEALEQDHELPIEAFPQSWERMGPACELLYELITRGGMTHDGDPRLRRHIRNARKVTSENSVRISKKNIRSRRWVDGAIATSMGVRVATDLAKPQAPGPEPMFAVT